jgi:hypothetical protein
MWFIGLLVWLSVMCFLFFGKVNISTSGVKFSIKFRQKTYKLFEISFNKD